MAPTFPTSPSKSRQKMRTGSVCAVILILSIRFNVNLVYVFYTLIIFSITTKLKLILWEPGLSQAWHCQCGKIITNRWEQGGNRKKGDDRENGY